MKKCAAWRAARWSSASTRTSPTAAAVKDDHRLAGEGRRAGREWLEELETSRHPWFNINVGDGFYHYHRSWNDDLSMPFAGIPGYIRRVQAGESLDRPVEKLQAERRQLIEDYRELLGTDEERGAYDQMITLAHRVFPYVEGHKFYCEHWYTNLFFNKIREFGGLLARAWLLRRRRGRVPAHALRARVGHHRSDDVMVHRLAAARPAALAGEGRRAARRHQGSGRSTKRHRRSGPCPTSSTTRPS